MMKRNKQRHFLDNSIWQKKHALHVILLVGLIQGLLYTFIVPPWLNHDEPGHFEFAWQVANFDHWPRADEFDPEFRLQMARSMDQYGYYYAWGDKPDLSGKTPVITGIPQYTQYPLYHLLASLPLRFLSKADLVVQFMAVRLVSTLLFILLLWISWMVLGEILPQNHPLQWLTVLLMALLPGLANIMTSVNDDVGAILAFSVFLWFSLRLIQRGFSWKDGLGLVFSLGLCFWTKTTAWPAIPLSLVTLMSSVFRKKLHWLPWAILGLILFVTPLVTLREGDAGLWYRQTNQSNPTRIKTNKTILGEYAFHIEFIDDKELLLNQLVDTSAIRPLRGYRVTLGAWMWADRPVKVRIPFLQMRIYEGNPQYREPLKYVMLTTTPTFYSQTIRIPLDAENGILRIFPLPAIEKGDPPISIYLDGIVLAQGKRDGMPQFDDPSGASGIWSNAYFTNLIRNGSAETGSIYLSPQLTKTISSVFPGSLDVFIASLQDRQSTSGYYRASLLQLLKTFWSMVPSARAEIFDSKLVYPFLQWVTALGLVGGLGLLVKRRRNIPWPALFFLGLTMITIWGLTVARGGGDLLSRTPLLPWARYGYPVILPTALLLCAGWWQVMQWLRIPPIWRSRILITFMILLNILTVMGVVNFIQQIA